ncbi:MAG: DUF4352 domain-containing protein [Chloroflexi bacterium]|nr:DUF4352 domain-containing protein [Chloroflexota bacterium]MYG90942.1 DUF4352 domain-containing protein [Chloroflexota bacterium]MYJ93168.1 DUF4352 domain-containing protein [Chloroflexota bacterium]
MLSGLSGTQRYALFVLLVVIVVVIYLFVSGGLGDLIGGDDEDQQVTEEPTSAPEALRTVAVEFGESQQVGPVEVSIIGLTFPDQIRAEGLWRTPAQRFAAVHLTMTNRSKQAVELPLDGLQLVTVDGRAYLADAALSLGHARAAESVAYSPPLILQPQLTITVVAVYDIPLDASGLQLRVRGGWTDFALFEE